MKEKLKQLLLYDGLETKEDYESIVKDIKAQNRKNICFYSLIVGIAVLCLFICSFFISGLALNRYTYLIAAVVTGIIFAGMYFFGKNLVVNTIFTYVFSSLLLGFEIFSGTINDTHNLAVSYCVFLVILPFVTYDMAIRSLAYRIIFTIIFIITTIMFKEQAIVADDIVDVISYGSIGAIAGILNQKIKTNSYFLNRNMNKEVEIKTLQIENITIETIGAMADTLEAKDEYTRGHSNRVSEYATLIARKMDLPEKTVSESAMRQPFTI